MDSVLGDIYQVFWITIWSIAIFDLLQFYVWNIYTKLLSQIYSDIFRGSKIRYSNKCKEYTQPRITQKSPYVTTDDNFFYSWRRQTLWRIFILHWIT